MQDEGSGFAADPPDALGRALQAAFAGSSAAESVVTAFERRMGSRSRVSLREEEGPPPAETPSEARIGRRYAVVGELGRGGMGVVLRGRDEDLGRDVALKFLRPELSGEARHVDRFLREAQVEGQLQHPGIVPVYELGLSLDGRPFFAMKLVRGQTLAELLAARSSPESERRRFLGIFEQVCHAVAYAHARGVVHRDLKPSNVMLGKFGEVQIVDWGFAKVLAASGPAPQEAAPADAPDEGGDGVAPGDVLATRAGSMLGTPPYMPPEQTGRRAGPVDERADVFSLGAILLEILTGEPAYRGADDEILRQAWGAELSDAHARLASCRADEAFVSLCRACLSADPGDRPRDAAEVTSRLTAHLASVEERAREAELDAAEARVRAEGERRARRLTVGLAAAVVLAGLLGSGGWLWVTHERRAQTDLASRDVERSLGEGRAMLSAARRSPVDVLAPWDAVLGTARAATARAGAALEGDRDEAASFLSLVASEREAAVARKGSWERNQETARRLADIRARGGGIADARDAEAAYRSAFLSRGIDPADEDRARSAIAASEIRDALVTALDDWASLRRVLAGAEDPLGTHLRALASAVDPDPRRKAIRDAVVTSDARAVRALEGPSLSPDAAQLLARGLSLAGDAAGAVDVLKRAWRLRPDDFWTSLQLAEALTVLPTPAWDEAAGYYRAALSVNASSKGAHALLAQALRQAGRIDEAIEVWRAELVRDPADTAPYRQLLDLHAEKGDLVEAMAGLEAEAQANPADPRPRVGLGLAFALRRQWAEAVAQLERAVAIDGRSPALRTHLAEALLWSGRPADATAQIDEALALDRGFATAWETLHRIRIVTNDPDGALAAIREAVRLGPDVPVHLFGLAAGLKFDGRLEEAEAVCDRFVELAPFESMAHQMRGLVLLDRRELAGGAAEIETAIRLVKRGLLPAAWGITQIGVYDAATKKYAYHCVPGWDPNLGPTRGALAMARLQMGDPEGALAALDVLPWDEAMRKNLAWIRQRIFRSQGRVEEALPILESLAGDVAVTGELLYNLGLLRLTRGDAARAREALLTYYDLAAWNATWTYPRAEWARDVEALVSLALGLPDSGAQEDADARAWREILRGLLLDAGARNHASMQAFQAAFQVAPHSAARLLPWSLPYPAAAAAAQSALLAGWGLGIGGAELPQAERASCRARALAWMREALDSMRLSARTDPENGPARLKLWAAHCPDQDGFSLVSEGANLRRLPPEEADAWRAFWKDLRTSAE